MKLNRFCLLFLLVSCVFSSFVQGDNLHVESDKLPTIKKIIVEGNKHVKKDAILKRIPYAAGQKFDAERSSEAINNLYGLGRFRQIKIEKEKLADDQVNIYVVVEERKLLEDIFFEGNKSIKSKSIVSQLKLDKLETIDEEQMERVSKGIKKLYEDKNYHLAKVDYKIVDNKQNQDKASVVFTIYEGKKAIVKRIFFRGNTFMPDRKLRTAIFTREDWILGFLDDAGKFDSETIEMDKKRIEYYYRDYGFLMAKVAKVDVEFVNNDKEINLTFDIKEGDLFTVRYLSAPGDELYTEDELLPYVVMEAGKPFCQTTLVKSIDKLKAQWGELGYIYADVYPQIIPNEETKEVDITFHVEKGKKMFVNRINITGNKFTKDRVIRREIDIEEGELITSPKLDRSKIGVNYLGFFEPKSVNWKIHRLADNLADLEMNLREAKTGRFNIAMTYGGDKGSSSRSLRGSVNLHKSNFLGRGWEIGSGIEGTFKRFQKASVFFFDPHIFDTDISMAISSYIKREEYEQWRRVTRKPVEKIAGGFVNFGFLVPKISRRTRVGVEVGFEHIKNNDPEALPSVRSLLQPIVDRNFQDGDLFWLGANIIKDTRNHRVYPSEGYKLAWNIKSAPGFLNSEFGFIKSELDWSWYTPLIGEDSLVLMVHAWGGWVDTVSKDRVIPYKELLHMGGQTTVRGFQWGQISPAWGTDAPLGARKAFQFNVELIFPLVPDYQMKGHVFYDAGAGWDTPKYGITDRSFIKRDKFNLRHSVGFGFNLTNPFPAKIDWGYKLDRDKEAGESPYEFHISMNKAF